MGPAETRGWGVGICKAPKGILLPGTPYCFVSIQDILATCFSVTQEKEEDRLHARQHEIQPVKITLLTAYKIVVFEKSRDKYKP